MGNESAPLRADDNDGRATYRRLQAFVRSHRRDQGRVNTLRLWIAARNDSGDVIKDLAEVERTDHPSVQALIERRDRYNEIRERIEQLQGILDGNIDTESGGKHDRIRAFETYERLSARAEKELAAIEHCLLDLRKEFASSAKTMAQILVEAAKLKYHHQAHREKMELAKNADPAQLANAELLKIAEMDD